MTLLQLLIGGLLLILGRKLFWLFVACLGFVIALRVSTDLLVGQPDWIRLLVAIVIGALGALLAVFLQRLAIAVAGFLAGAYLVEALWSAVHPSLGVSAWAAVIIGGILGAILLSALFDWALIVLSSLAGASIISQTLPIGTTGSTVLFVLLGVLGIAVQAGWMRADRRTGR